MRNKRFVKINFKIDLQVKQVWKELPIEGGQIDYLKLVTIIKRGKEDE